MPAFAITIFIGAFLLFQVQPLIGKFVLPWFGGTPAVWTTCMLFFQVLLLGGYAYAHWLTTWVKPRKQAALHMLLVLAALTMLPITPSPDWKPTPGVNPTAHILLLLLASIGLPYFVLSSTGPLMQKWFSWIQPGRSPYWLYALSNVGSFLALLSFPFYFEPMLSRQRQADVWTLGLLAFVIGCGACAWRLWRWGKDRDTRPDETPTDEVIKAVTRRQLALWLLLPATASALLLATTNKLTQDVAVIPFLWVLPLAIYLFTFILCFAEFRFYRRRVFLPLYFAAVAGVIHVLENLDHVNIFTQVGTFSAVLFAACMICHGELVRVKPHPRHLTRFYLMMSLGGALGGMFVALVAPLIFTTYVEFHLTLWFAALLTWVACLPTARGPSFRLWHLKVWYCGALLVIATGVALFNQGNEEGENIVAEVRNFYGSMYVLSYEEDDAEATPYLLLRHGRITHGFQVMSEARRGYATSYYGIDSGVGVAIDLLPTTNRTVGVVGLGTGTLAVYGRPGDRFRFYEINPEVIRFAREHFTFLNDCDATVEMSVGDARLNLEREDPQGFDLLALDAFSSDAIPVHLLTSEAFDLYTHHLKPGGCLAIHISNRYLDLEPVVRNAAKVHGYESVTIVDDNLTDDPWVYESTWMILSRDREFVQQVAAANLNKPVEPSEIEVALWTDDYTSLFPILYSEASESDEDYEEDAPGNLESMDLENIDLDAIVKGSETNETGSGSGSGSDGSE